MNSFVKSLFLPSTMKYSIAFLSTMLCATTVLARPSSSERYAQRVARRAAARSSGLLNKVESFDTDVSNETQVSYSTNWAGSVIESPPSGTTWKTITGQFTVPSASGSSGASASAWVGIDGDTCETAILQTGIDFNAGGTYDAWYEWYPDYAYDFSLSISAGDVIKTTVTASSTKAGSAVIENVTTGKSVTKSLSSSSALCLENAEWIIEDFEEGDSLVPFADFGTVTFTNAVATTNTGSTEGPSSGLVLDIKQNSKVLTSVSTSSSGMTVTYV